MRLHRERLLCAVQSRALQWAEPTAKTKLRHLLHARRSTENRLTIIGVAGTIFGVTKYIRPREVRIANMHVAACMWQELAMAEPNFSFDWIWNLLKNVCKSTLRSLGRLQNRPGSNNSFDNVSKLMGNRVSINSKNTKWTTKNKPRVSIEDIFFLPFFFFLFELRRGETMGKPEGRLEAENLRSFAVCFVRVYCRGKSRGGQAYRYQSVSLNGVRAPSHFHSQKRRQHHR